MANERSLSAVIAALTINGVPPEVVDVDFEVALVELYKAVATGKAMRVDTPHHTVLRQGDVVVIFRKGSVCYSDSI